MAGSNNRAPEATCKQYSNTGLGISTEYRVRDRGRRPVTNTEYRVRFTDIDIGDKPEEKDETRTRSDQA